MVEVTTFDGGLDEIHRLIRASWLQDYREKYKQPVIDYASIPFLEWNLNRPKSDPELRLGAYLDNQLVGFAGGIPVTLKLDNRKIKSLLGSFLTTHVDYKGQGIGKALARKFVRRALDLQFDLLYSVTDEGHAADNLFRTVAKPMRIPYRTFYRFTFLSKPLDKQKIRELTDLPLHQKLALPLFTKKAGKTSKHQYDVKAEDHLSQAVEMMNQAASSKALSSCWSEDELHYDMTSRFTNIFFSETGQKRGLIVYYRMDLLGCTSHDASHPMTVIDCVRFANMSIFEKHRFISDFCSQEKQMGACMVAVPTMPGFDLKPFYTNLFYPSGRYHCFVGCDLKNLLHFPVVLDYLIFR